MIITVSGASALQSALSSAQAGDTIQLASGNYGALRISGRNFSDDVVIKAADGATPVFTGLTVNSSSGLTFRGLELSLSTPNSADFTIAGSQDVHIVGFNVHGVLDGNSDADPWGLYL